MPHRDKVPLKPIPRNVMTYINIAWDMIHKHHNGQFEINGYVISANEEVIFIRSKDLVKIPGHNKPPGRKGDDIQDK